MVRRRLLRVKTSNTLIEQTRKVDVSAFVSTRPSATLMFDLLVLTVIGISLFSAALLWRGL